MIELSDEPNPGFWRRLLLWLLPRHARFDRYDETAREVLFFARHAVSECGGRTVEPGHLVIGLAASHPEAVAPFLTRADLLDALVARMRERMARPERIAESVEVPFTRGTVRVLRVAMDAARAGDVRVRP